MVYQKQLNEQGPYIGQDGKRYEILSCHVTESKEWVQTGTDTEVIEGETVEVPVMESRVVINKGWDEYENEEAAASGYGFVCDPLLKEEEMRGGSKCCPN